MISPPIPVRAPRHALVGTLVGSLVCLGAVACGRGDAGTADSALARDLTLATSASTSAARSAPVAFADTAVAARMATPAPAVETPRRQSTAAPRRTGAPRAATRPTPEPAPEAPIPAPAAEPQDAPAAPAAAPAAPTGPAGHTLGAGTGMVLATAQPICTVSNRSGDRFVASLRDPVTAADGEVLPAGTDVVLELASVIVGPAERGRVQLVARGISLGGFIRPIDAEVAWVDTTLERRSVATAGAGGDAGKVGRGAMTGAILGSVFGGGAKGTVIGAAAGAAVGAAGARKGTQYEGCLPKGATVRMRLTAPLTVGT